MSHNDIAYYTVASRVVLITILVLSILNTILTPILSRYFHLKNIQKITTTIVSTFRVLIFFSLIIITVLVFFGKNILLIFGEEYLLSYEILLILLIGQFINLVCGPVGPILNMSGHQNILTKITLEALCINIIFSVVLGLQFGINGVAFGTSIALAYWNIKGVIIIKNYLGFNILPWKSIFNV